MKNNRILSWKCAFCAGFLILMLATVQTAFVHAATPGLPFTEDFVDTNLRDTAKTNANWSTEEQKLIMAWRQAQFGAFGADTVSSDITADDSATYSVAVGDVDGDGDLDVVAGNKNQTNRLYLNNGTADPFNGVTGSDITSDSHQTESVALGDLDGDGDLDVVAGSANQAIRLYLNNGTANPFNGVTGSDITSDASWTRSVALGDMDGDGDLDVVAGNEAETNQLYLNNGTVDPFNGVSGSNITSDSHNTYSVALGDMDGDGYLDVVAGNSSQANRLYLNNGTADPFNSVSGSDVTSDSHQTLSVALGDMDGDGDLDVVAGNYAHTNRLYLNDGSGDPYDTASGSDITSDAHDTTSVALGDVDGDGDLDLVAGNYIQINRLYLNNGTADSFSGVSGSDITAETGKTWSVTLGDMDGDGDLDVIAGNDSQTNRLYLNPANLNPWTGITAGANVGTNSGSTWPVAVGDIDGDGDLDIVAGDYNQTNKWYANDGSSNPFDSAGTGKQVGTDTDGTRAIALADIDGDGDLDVLAGNYTDSAQNRWYPNDGDADPFNTVGAGTLIGIDTDATQSLAVVDIDGDGDLDVVAGNGGSSNIKWYASDGDATPFSGVGAGTSIGTGDWDDSERIVVADIDGDGDLDVLAGNQGATNKWYANDGTDTPFSGIINGTNIGSDTDDTRGFGVGDLDGDGDLDVVAGNDNGQQNKWYRNDGDNDPFSSVGPGTAIGTDANKTRVIALADLDADGDLDVVAGNREQNKWYANDGDNP